MGTPRVFVSHSAKDAWVARQIAAEIRRRGAETFLDEADIAHSDDFEEAILKAEETCTELLVLLTPWSLKRSWVWLEIGFFRHARKRIVGVLYGLSAQDLSADPDVASVLTKLDMVELNSLDSYLDQLSNRLGAVP